MNKVVFHPKAREIVHELDDDVKSEFGQALHLLQRGATLGLPLSRPMLTVGKGVHELRIRGRQGNFRFFYCLAGKAEIWVFHVFQKKTQQTNVLDIELARRRLGEFQNEKK